jgi:hypothetical protein
MPSPPATEILLRGKNLNNQMVGETSAWIAEMPQYVRRIERTTVGAVQTLYIAWAPYGTAAGAAGWMVQKLVIDKTTDLDITAEIAGGEAGQFAFTWTGRAGHAYS